MIAEIHTGSCLCGAVRLQTTGPRAAVVFCHCSQCRKQTGLHYAATDVDLEQLQLEGEEHVRWYRSSDSARRGFCSNCGSALFWQSDGADYISIMAGAFDMPADLKPGCHIYCSDKADFYTLTDDLPKFDGNRP